MATECTQRPTGRTCAIGRRAAAVAMAAAGAAGMAAAAVALAAPVEPEILVVAALALSVSPLVVRLQSRGRSRTVELPLWHPVLLASSLVFAPAGAALPGLVSGIGRALVDRGSRPLKASLFGIFRPAGICAGASAAYSAAGGGRLAPQSVDSLGPVIAAAAAYSGLSLMLVWAADLRNPQSECRSPSEWSAVLAGWCAVFAGGYAIAALHSSAPSYVLLAPALAAGVAQWALQRSEEPAAKQEDSPPVSAPDAQATADGSFVDCATGLANRRYLMMFLQSNLSRAQRKGDALSVAIVDLGLPAIVSEHSADTAVRLAGSAVRDLLRDYDLISRYSRGRLLLVFPETTSARSLEIVLRLLEPLGGLAEAGVPVRATAGIASYPEHAQTLDDLVNCAHHALNCGRATGAGAQVCSNLAEAS